MQTPILDMLHGAKGRGWLHMPGHGGELPWLDGALDMTELPVTDDLYAPTPDGPIDMAQRLAAKACGAAQTVFLTGGSTQGMQAMILYALPRGGTLILPRNAHKSAFSACVLGDIRPAYVWPKVEDGYGFLREDDVIRTMEDNPQASAVLITRPDYAGVCIGLERMSSAAKRLGMMLLVDEAHGAHLPYGGSISSASRWADIWVQSAHKTLPALTQSAYLHGNNSVDVERLRSMAALVGTSSPSFLLLASLDWARAQMQENGQRWITETIRANQAVCEKTKLADVHETWRSRGHVCDPSRLVLDGCKLGYGGYDLQQALTDCGIDIEMADACRIVCLPSLMDCMHIERLGRVLAQLPERKSIQSDYYNSNDAYVFAPQVAMTLREAAFAHSCQIPMEQGEGRIAAQSFGPYPPGIPLAAPGEIISAQMIEICLATKQSAGSLFGCNHGKITVVKDE